MNGPANVFGVQTGTLHPDGRVTPWEVKVWEVLHGGPQEDYLAFGPEEDTGEMRYRVAARVTDLQSSAGAAGYLGEAVVVKSPRQAARTHFEAALRGCGAEALHGLEGQARELAEYRAFLEHGLCAPVYACAGFWAEPESWWTACHRLFSGEDGQEQAWKWVKGRIEEESAQVYGLLGFYLDLRLNRLGARGWDLLEGRLEGPEARSALERRNRKSRPGKDGEGG
jgi:hypothetical protein